MRHLKYIIILALFAVASCDVEYYDNPNAPQTPPTSSLFNEAMYQNMFDAHDEWFMGRFTQVTMQYWNQSEYGDEDRYVYRESMRQTWQDFYANAENLRQVIAFNTNEETKGDAAAYGNNENQIACARVMLAWTFNLMADTWGDIPYYSYGSDSENFQALQLDDDVDKPAYATQQAIYEDILNELQAAADQMVLDAPGFTQGDNVYGGDMNKWYKFANSLRLRIANKIKDVSSGAQAHIDDAIADGVFTSNDDNAMYAFENNSANGAPFFIAWNVNNRSDFAVGHSFMTLLNGENLVDHDGNDINTNPFNGIVDPRRPIYAQPNSEGNFVGMFIAESSAESATFTAESLPGTAIIDKADYAVTLMEYAEVEFILSEENGWDQTHYENGIRASMEKWGVADADITSYLDAVPAANEENVLTQKYLALYMDAHTAWAEYRRTGYPTTLIPPFADYKVTVPSSGEELDKTFNALVAVDDIPYRMRYPQYEQTLNEENRAAAVERSLSEGDVIYSKLWWDVD